MRINENNGNIIIKNIDHFNLDNIFNSGQIFRFNKSAGDIYTWAAYGRIIKISQTNDKIIFYDMTTEEFKKWTKFFALDEDYESIVHTINTDEFMLRALQYGKGIRILKQDPWEMLISFIVSQNNNIPRIKKIIQALCENFGTEIISENERNFTFPAPVQLERATQNELKQIGLGYRDGYIMDAISKISWGEIDLDRIQKSDTGQARSELMKIKGVGGKVADCILLFGLSRYEACPHDVWVKRIFSEKYRIEKINEKKGYEFAQKKWGAYAGIAQQYLFYYEREHYKSKN